MTSYWDSLMHRGETCPRCSGRKNKLDSVCSECKFQSELDMADRLRANFDGYNEQEVPDDFTDEQVAQIKYSVKSILKKEILELLAKKDFTIPDMGVALGEREALIQQCVNELLDSNEIQSNDSKIVYKNGVPNHWAEYGLVKNTKLKKEILELLAKKDCTMPNMMAELEESDELIQQCVGDLERTDKIELKGFHQSSTGSGYHWAIYGLKSKTAEGRFKEGLNGQKKDLSAYPDDDKDTSEKKKPEEDNPILRRMKQVSL